MHNPGTVHIGLRLLAATAMILPALPAQAADATSHAAPTAAARATAVTAPVVLSSAHPFGETLERLRTALAEKGMVVFATIDHADAARQVGLKMPPTTVLIFGNPVAGTPLMVATPDLALDLPLRVLVRADAQGRVQVLHHATANLPGSPSVPEGAAAQLAPVAKLIAGAVGSAAAAE